MSREASLDWHEIYERLVRWPERPDALAMAALDQRVRAWTRDDEVAAETCVEVWRTLNLARGGASFEGFVQGRFVEVARRSQAPPPYHETPLRCAARTSATPTSPRPPSPLPIAMERGSNDDVGLNARLEACLGELAARNPRHHRVLSLLYEDRATVAEAADVLAVDVWTVRALAARARAALVQCLERAERQHQARAERGGRGRASGGTGADGERTARPGGRPGRPGGKSSRQRKGRPPGSGGPR